MNKYFKNCNSLEELKKEYKRLAKLYHPDITRKDTNKEMADINNEYQSLFENLKNVKFSRINKQYYESKEPNRETAAEFINIIDKLIKIKNIDVMICGTWLWVTGETFAIKKLLKELNFCYYSGKKAWAVHYDDFKKRTKRTLSLEEIETIFETQKFTSENEQLLLK